MLELNLRDFFCPPMREPRPRSKLLEHKMLSHFPITAQRRGWFGSILLREGFLLSKLCLPQHESSSMSFSTAFQCMRATCEIALLQSISLIAFGVYSCTKGSLNRCSEDLSWAIARIVNWKCCTTIPVATMLEMIYDDVLSVNWKLFPLWQWLIDWCSSLFSVWLKL